MENTVATGAALGMLDIGLETFKNVLRKAFKEKGGEVIKRNIACAEAGYNYARTNCTDCEAFRIQEPEYRKLMLIDGVHAIGIGAVISGCKFYSGYPMTPSTGILDYMALEQKIIT